MTKKIHIVVQAFLCEIVKGNVGIEIVKMVPLSREFLESGFCPIIQLAVLLSELIVYFPKVFW